jgi:ABC-type uncharacterized transport system substrate-binding protein
VAVSDPIGPGLVAILARPDANLTGVLSFEDTITGKWLAMLKEIAPRLERIAFVSRPIESRDSRDDRIFGANDELRFRDNARHNNYRLS